MDIKTTSYFFAYAAVASAALPFLIGIWHFSERPLYQKIVWLVVAVALSCDILGFFVRNNSAGNIYRLVEFIGFYAAFYLAFGQIKWKTFFLISGIICLLFFAANLAFIQQDKVNTYTNTFSALVFIPLAILFFYRLMQDLPAQKIQHLPMFWIAIAVLIYFSGTLFLFSIFDYHATAATEKDLIKLYIYWGFHNFLLVVKNILFAIALWQKIPTPRLQ